MDHRKSWTQQQTLLRKLLSSKASSEQGVQLFLQQHAATHTAAITPGLAWSLEDDALAGLSEGQVRYCPRPEINSIAWLLWHITRIEDMTINFLVLERPQVYMSADWAARLGLPLPDCGAGMDEAEVESFSAQVSVMALKAYRAAVGQTVQSGVCQLQAAQLKEMVPNASVDELVKEGSISAKAGWLSEFYYNRTKGFFLTRTATSHNFLHLNQAARLGKKLVRKGL